MHRIGITAGDQAALAEVTVMTDEPRRGEPKDDTPIEQPGKKVLLWRGAIQPQKWMNFHTKVLTRFASSLELMLEVSFEAPIDRDQAQAKADDRRSGLTELGLDHTTSLTRAD